MFEHQIINEANTIVEKQQEAKKKVSTDEPIPTATYKDILEDFCRIANLAQLHEHYLTFENGDIVIREATSNDEEVMRMSQDFFNQHSKYRVEIETSPKIDFNDDEKIIYTPDLWDNDEKEGYTGKDFLDLCNGDEKSAKNLFEMCEWQHPETILDEMSRKESIENLQTISTTENFDNREDLQKFVNEQSYIKEGETVLVTSSLGKDLEVTKKEKELKNSKKKKKTTKRRM